MSHTGRLLARLPLPLGLVLAATLGGLVAPAGAGTEVPAGEAPAVIRYQVRGRANTIDVEEFAGAAAETYADPRGWGGGGAVRFERVPSNGDFTLWLAADAAMASFGGACGRVWSCRSGRNVVINQARWLGATPAWNEAGASLRDYRHMVVNHETGHWLLQGHQHCAGAGQPAPVMQQQSMGLQGCAANPWPLPAELARALAGARVGAAGAAGDPGVTGAPGGAPPAGAGPGRGSSGEGTKVEAQPSWPRAQVECAYRAWRRTSAACLR